MTLPSQRKMRKRIRHQTDMCEKSKFKRNDKSKIKLNKWTTKLLQAMIHFLRIENSKKKIVVLKMDRKRVAAPSFTGWTIKFIGDIFKIGIALKVRVLNLNRIRLGSRHIACLHRTTHTSSQHIPMNQFQKHLS